MEAEKATPDNVDGFEIARMARLLEVSRSGYYDWAPGRSRASGAAAPQRSRQIIPTTDSDQVYGSPRILADLREAGERCRARRWPS